MYNLPDMTRKCIDSVLKDSGVPIDILVVDDHSREVFSDERVRVLRLPENKGFTAATNAGILETWNDYKYLLFLNNDIIAYPNFVKYLLEAMEKDDLIGIAGASREEVYDGKTYVTNYSIDLLAGAAACTDEDLPKEKYYCIWLSLCASLIKTDVIKQVGLLDRRMKFHCSDNDFCVRAGVMGYRVALIPKAKVIHEHEATIKTMTTQIKDDQAIMLSKLRCDFFQNMLNTLPLDHRQKIHGHLEFKLIS
jgi:GT2 family glycosyltransferase